MPDATGSSACETGTAGRTGDPPRAQPPCLIEAQDGAQKADVEKSGLRSSCVLALVPLAPATIAAIPYFIPDPFPLFAPGKRALAHRANLLREVFAALRVHSQSTVPLQDCLGAR